jgi:hypothetical protein
MPWLLSESIATDLLSGTSDDESGSSPSFYRIGSSRGSDLFPSSGSDLFPSLFRRFGPKSDCLDEVGSSENEIVTRSDPLDQMSSGCERSTNSVRVGRFSREVTSGCASSFCSTPAHWVMPAGGQGHHWQINAGSGSTRSSPVPPRWLCRRSATTRCVASSRGSTQLGHFFASMIWSLRE